MTFYDKIKWTLGILMVFVLIIATNLIDRNNFLRVKNSVVSIYEDRLVANDLIFEMANSVHEKEIAFAKLDSVFFLKRNAQVNRTIDDLLVRFELTKLTKEEELIFNDLKKNLNFLINSEKKWVESNFSEKTSVHSHILNVNKNLYTLSKIQLSEGSRQNSISKKAIDSVELFTQVEIYILVFLAIMIQIIVMYKPTKKN